MTSTELLQDEPLGSKLIKKSFWLYFFMIFTAPVGYIIKVIVSNTLSVEDVWLFYAILGFIGLISIYNDLGLTEALQYFLPKYHIEKNFNALKTITFLTLWIQIISGILLGSILRRGSDRLALYYFKSVQAWEILRLFVWYFIGINFFQVCRSFFTAFQNTFASSFIDFVRSRSVLGFTLWFRLTQTLTPISFTISWLGWVVIAVFISLFLLKKYYSTTLSKGSRSPTSETLKTQFKYAFWTFMSANTGMLFTQLDMQMVMYFLGHKAAGIFSNFYSLITISSILTGPILGIVFPIVSELQHKSDQAKLNLLISLLITYLWVFGMIIAGGFAALWTELALILFGVKFIASGVLLKYGAFRVILTILVGLLFQILSGKWRVKFKTIMLWACFIFSFVSNTLIIPRLGLTWVIIGTTVSYSILLGAIVWKLHIPLQINRKLWITNVLLIIILGLAITYFKGSIFVYENSARTMNFIWLIIIGIWYLSIIGGVNYRTIMSFIQEIKKIKG